jgi:peptidoglycan/LPS O-acetylase OafA/YrhL
MGQLVEPASQSASPVQTALLPPSAAHVPALDGIRGLAILLVLFDHLFWANGHTGNRLLDFISILRDASYVGVNIFFALSGFLITGILLDTIQTPHFFRNFYARRTLRIFPLYYGVLFVLLLITRPLHITWSGWQYFYLTYSANLVVWQRPQLLMPHLNFNHFWSLQVEEQFYLVWPFIVYRVRDHTRVIRLALAICFAVLLIRIGIVLARPWLHNPYLPYSPTFSCADNLLYGCCLATLFRTSLRDRILHFAPRIFFLCAAILIAVGILNGGLNWNTSVFIPTIGFSLIGIASASLIAMSLRNGSLPQKLFSNSWLRFFGKYSYGLYVFHYSVSAALNPPLRAFFDARFHNKGIGVLAGAVICLVVSILIALASYHLYEVHFLRLKRLFSYDRNALSQGQGATVVP